MFLQWQFLSTMGSEKELSPCNNKVSVYFCFVFLFFFKLKRGQEIAVVGNNELR